MNHRLTCLVLIVLSAGWARAEPAPLSDAFKAPRPLGGEYFGVYLLSKKVGYLFSDLVLEPEVPGHTRLARGTSELHFRATVGSGISERHHKEIRIYEAKPNGRLLSFTVEQKGDGGDQTLEGKATPSGVDVKVTRPGQPPRTVHLPPTREKVEDSDSPRVALYRNATVEGSVIDAQDLATYKVTTTVGPSETQTLRGVPMLLRSTTSLSDKEKVPIKAFIADSGEVVELSFGEMMKARAEAPAVAKRLDQVEVFGLTRVVIPKALPDSVHEVPGQVTWVVKGLPESFQKQTARQQFRPLPDGQVEVTSTAEPPTAATASTRVPLKDPEGGSNLRSSIVVEADNPEIKALARKIAAGDKGAYSLTKKVSAWVGTNLRKSYGTSADRASEVLRQLKGDCTEHSLLTVALLRSLGIPAKRVDGLVYLINEDRVPALYWHEWVEAWVGSEWTQIDPTFGQPVADATHFGLGEEGNAEITPLIGQLKIIDVRASAPPKAVVR